MNFSSVQHLIGADVGRGGTASSATPGTGSAVLHDPEFVRMVAEREARRARELRDEKVRELGYVVRTLRERKQLSRAALVERGAPSLQYVYLLERGLLTFDELSRERVESLARALEIDPEALAGCARLTLTELPPHPWVSVLAVGDNAAAILGSYQRRGTFGSLPTGVLELVHPDRVGPPPDYIGDRFVRVPPDGHVSVADFIKGTDLLLIVADLTEYGRESWPLDTIARYAAEKQKTLVASLLLFRPSDPDPLIPVREPESETGWDDVPLREVIARSSHMFIALNLDTLAANSGASGGIESRILAEEQFSQVFGDLVLAFQNQDLTGLRQRLRRNRPAALGWAQAKAHRADRRLVEQAVERSATDTDFSVKRPFVMVSIRTGAMSEREEDELRKTVQRSLGKDSMITVLRNQGNQPTRALVIAP
jgi:hypothetical protein